MPHDLLEALKSLDGLALVSIAILWISGIVLMVSVVYKFIEHRQNRRHKRLVAARRHAVETFTMAAVIVILFNVLQAGVGTLETDFATRVLAVGFGAALTALGVCLHLWSKIAIGAYWSNKIEVAKEQIIVTTGPYAVVRHPMYSSLILWLVGLSILFLNYISLLGTLLIFIPMMVIRADAEDKLLREVDRTGFGVYSRSVRQFVPRFDGGVSLSLRLIVIGMLAYTLISREMDIVRFMLLFVAHLTTGIIIKVPKISFAYINKSFMMAVFFFAMQLYPPAFWLFGIPLVFNIWGLFADCPCMMIYTRFNGCPCFDLMKGWLSRKHGRPRRAASN